MAKKFYNFGSGDAKGDAPDPYHRHRPLEDLHRRLVATIEKESQNLSQFSDDAEGKRTKKWQLAEIFFPVET